jgi:hypothetical protein
MSANQEEQHIDLRASTSTARDFNSDWLAQFAKDLITTGSINERMLAWLNAELSASHTSLNAAMAAYAAGGSFTRWNDINNLTGL